MGGLTSTIELPAAVIGKYGKNNVHMYIAALAGEHRDLWRLVEESEKRFNKKITRVSYRPAAKGLRKYLINAPESMWCDIWDVFEEVNLIGNTRQDPCSRVLKRETSKRYLLDHFPPHLTTLHFGITDDEIDRTIAIGGAYRRLGYKVEFDLASDDKITSAEAKLSNSLSKVQRAEQLLGWVPELYAQGHDHLNCGGFCVKAGQKSMAMLLLNHPDVFYYHAERERQWNEKRGKNFKMIRKQKDGERFYLSLYEFAEKILSAPEQLPLALKDTTPACGACGAI